MVKNPDSVIEKAARELLDAMDIEYTLKLINEDSAYRLALESPQAAMLIGNHGRTLEALQLILSHLVFKRLGGWQRLVVDVGDYRERRAEQLAQLAYNAAAEVIETKDDVTLPELSPTERREIHMALADHPQVVSESQGEGLSRRLVVKLR